jgi:hypothetical protein
MSVTQDIVATYRRPRRIVAQHVKRGQNEPRALMFLMLACGLMFIAQLPLMSRQAYEEKSDVNALMGAALMGWIFIAPLLFYAIAWVSNGAMRVITGYFNGFGARLALFWALLAATPLMLLQGLVAGFIGKGLELTIAQCLWFFVLLWFWISGLRAVFYPQEEGT